MKERTNVPIWNDTFSHIYAEEAALSYPIADKLIKRLNAKPVHIKHYKDVFNRSGQDFRLQKNSPKLILAKRHNKFLYEGAPIYEHYNNKFYYATLMMNCLYNCRYCYLQGLYQSANIVVFVNPEDYLPVFKQAAPAYISISYDTDIMALEHLFGYAAFFIDFARHNPSITMEIRTKSAGFNAISDIMPASNIILSWTLSPQKIIDVYELSAPSLISRIKAAKSALDKGWRVRICFDPILPFEAWEEDAEQMLDLVQQSIDLKAVDISIGGFRMSVAHFKSLKRMHPAISYPFLINDGSIVKCKEEEIEKMRIMVEDRCSKNQQ